MIRLHINSFMGFFCTVASYDNIHGKLLFMVSLFSLESIVGFYHLQLVTYCGYYRHVHA